MEYEIELIVRRYKDSTDPDGYPNEKRVYEGCKVFNTDYTNVDSLLDDWKEKVEDAIEADKPQVKVQVQSLYESI